MWLETQYRSKIEDDRDDDGDDRDDDDDFPDDDDDDDDDDDFPDDDDDDDGSVNERSSRSSGNRIKSLTFFGLELRSDDE